MLLVVDVGNTNIVGGVYEGKRLVETLRIHTVIKKTEDEYGTIFKAIFQDRKIDPELIDRAAVSSVVPALTDSICSMVSRMIGRMPLLLGPSVYPILPIKIVNPYEIGSDLVANAFAAYTNHKCACIIVDFGTALTFTCIDYSGEILGVSIVPGLGTAVASLSRDTAQLPYVQLALPSSPLGKNTVQSIQSGIVFGYTGLVEYIVGRMKAEVGSEAKVIATGGLCRTILPLTKVFNEVDMDLTLNGLMEIEAMCGKNG
jgi:type III pantothenate kinase